MALATASGVEDICRTGHRTRLMDIIIAVQRRYGAVTHDSMGVIARAVGTQRVEVESAVTFYSFLSLKPQGRARRFGCATTSPTGCVATTRSPTPWPRNWA